MQLLIEIMKSQFKIAVSQVLMNKSNNKNNRKIFTEKIVVLVQKNLISWKNCLFQKKLENKLRSKKQRKL